MHKHLVVSATLLFAVGAAQAQIAVVGNPGANALPKEEVADVFLGKNTALKPVDQPEAAPIRAEFYKKATGRDPAQIKATWSRLVFSGKAVAPKEVGDASAVKKAVAADPKAVGYIDQSAVDATVKVLATVP